VTLVTNSRFTACSRVNNSAGLLSRVLLTSQTNAVAGMVAEPLNSPPVSLLELSRRGARPYPQKAEARRRRAQGDTPSELARSYELTPTLFR